VREISDSGSQELLIFNLFGWTIKAQVKKGLNMFEIEKNIPAPNGTGKAGARPKYPFAQMDVGDSFFVPGMKSSALSNATQWHASKTGKKFTCTAEADGARCWRVA
jgi:hypothetical protein